MTQLIDRDHAAESHRRALATTGAINTVDPAKSAFIELGNGVFFDVLNPADHAEKITVARVSHNLSMLNRFGGNPKRAISVAEHSLQCSRMVRHCMTSHELVTMNLKDVEREALFHDDPEAFLVDIVRPVKLLLTGYREIEDGIKAVSAEKFGVPAKMSRPVHEVDSRMCLTEKLAFMGSHGLDNPAWASVYSVYKPFRFTFLPRWLDWLINRGECEKPTVYYNLFMWPSRAAAQFIARYKQVAA